jgi:DNA mismatch repair ATPase MutS
MSAVNELHGKYLQLTAGTFGELPDGYEGMLSSYYAERFTQDELINMINMTKEL